jgi:hypothetical protein
VIEEALRWMPTTLSAAVPHSLKHDDEYNEWQIPTNSVMMMNVCFLPSLAALCYFLITLGLGVEQLRGKGRAAAGL